MGADIRKAAAPGLVPTIDRRPGAAPHHCARQSGQWQRGNWERRVSGHANPTSCPAAIRGPQDSGQWHPDTNRVAAVPAAVGCPAARDEAERIGGAMGHRYIRSVRCDAEGCMSASSCRRARTTASYPDAQRRPYMSWIGWRYTTHAIEKVILDSIQLYLIVTPTRYSVTPRSGTLRADLRNGDADVGGCRWPVCGWPFWA